MREYSRNPTYPDGDAYDPTYSPVTGKEVKMKEPELKLRCPVCGSAEIRTSKVTGISWCRRCGHEAPKAEFEERVKKEV